MGLKRARIILEGAVQGVGMRPFIYGLANRYGLKGWVKNFNQGVLIEAEGPETSLERFMERLYEELPPLARVYKTQLDILPLVGYKSFEIKDSVADKPPTALMLPDMATCEDCVKELFNPSDRRYLYPFINCTNCGPRFTIMKDLPYDRPNTTMESFEMCEDCKREYHDPQDRRFHAQPIACPVCGPQIELWDREGKTLAQGFAAIAVAADLLIQEKILALKGLGGFHLISDALKEGVVRELRRRKQRGDKPFALMFGDLEMIREYCLVSSLEERVLTSRERPIVLLRKRPTAHLAPSVAPDSPYLGVMLPYTPLHILLMRTFRFPIVATSGNLKDEPILLDEGEALERLGGVADYFLVHNRPIRRQADDSIVRVMSGRPVLIRRARGYALLPIRVNKQLPQVLAVGAQLKNTVAFSLDDQIFISQHIGDLETYRAYRLFTETISDVLKIYRLKPLAIACDLHPDYISTKYALDQGYPLIPIQHHQAHIASCMVENDLEEEVLGIAWDGAGWGLDGSIWGGEFFVGDYQQGFQRVATLRPFGLPGAVMAMREPRRVALSVLWTVLEDELWNKTWLLKRLGLSPGQLRGLMQILPNGRFSPPSTSVGRLFDAVSSLLGLVQVNDFEGQAAMYLESLLKEREGGGHYGFKIEGSSPLLIDWVPLFRELILDLEKGLSPSQVAVKFHNTLVQIILEVARIVKREKIVLSGGVFQNSYLTEETCRILQKAHFRVFLHQKVPPNDGGISLGQVIMAAHQVLRKGS